MFLERFMNLVEYFLGFQWDTSSKASYIRHALTAASTNFVTESKDKK